MDKVPVNDTVIYALERLVDDAQKERRDPRHSDIEFQINRVELINNGPNKGSGPPVGKARRIRTILSWALDNDVAKAEKFSAGIISPVKAFGGFRKESPNYVGSDAINNLKNSFKSLGTLLGNDGAMLLPERT